ncbi:SRPBCC family protein [Paenibacillus vulneris]|uniref:SRPBCC family protein n=1 Tax=Paenibacillus vulneris TaxID=1133364 RepID=A0ABW3UKV0_9BACL
MLAELRKADHGFIAQFERHYKHSIEEVWAYLTENEKLNQWFPELEVEELRQGGLIRFNMPDGTQLDMMILDMKSLSALEYTWGEDRVRFELAAEPGGCLLYLKETIQAVTPHTPKDLAGWHVCLDVIAALLNDTVMDRKREWERMYEQYIQAVEKTVGSL